MKHGRSAVFISTIALSFLASCGSSSSNGLNLNDTSTGQIYANSWQEIAIEANLAKTKVTSTGHYETTRNSCSRPGDGAMSLDEWNAFASSMNQAMNGLNIANPKICIPIDFRACMDGTVNVVRDDGSRVPLFEPGTNGGGETCTHLQDKDLAERLYKSINGITYAADRAGCTLEWERCTR